MRALIVGAGAVGQVYGRHLQLGGAEVAFLVREKYAAACRSGFLLYPLNGRRAAQRLDGFGVRTGADAADWSGWDAIVITVSSAALRDGGWLAELGARSGDATVVSLQPGLDDRDFILRHVPAERLLSGMISFVSYPAPLPGESRFIAPGMAYWFPPLAPSPFSGPAARVGDFLAALRRGGLPAKRHPDVPSSVGFPNAVLTALLLALEGAGWSFRAVRRGDWLGLAARAAREAMALFARERAISLPFARRLVRPLLLRAILRIAPLVVPLDLETYLRVHFTKVGDQTRLFVRGFLDAAARFDLPAPALAELVARIRG